MGTASAEGQEPACAKSVPPAAARGLCHTRYKSQGWAVPPGSCRDAVLQDTGSQAQQAQECFG